MTHSIDSLINHFYNTFPLIDLECTISTFTTSLGVVLSRILKQGAVAFRALPYADVGCKSVVRGKSGVHVRETSDVVVLYSGALPDLRL
jgi:hypothetical protein